jgi:hypothetical protein
MRGGCGKTVQSPHPWPDGLPLAPGRCAAPHPLIDWRCELVLRSWRGNACALFDRLIRCLVRTLRLALGRIVPLTTPGQGVTPLNPESPHGSWQRQNRAVSAPLAGRPAGGTGALRCTASLGRLALRPSFEIMATSPLAGTATPAFRPRTQGRKAGVALQ